MFIQKTSGSRVRKLQVQVRESGGRGAGGALPVHAAGGQPWGRGRAPGRRHTHRLGQAGDCNQAWSRGGEI